jgi:aminoglycoside/choline kinase family phosphotransferase
LDVLRALAIRAQAKPDFIQPYDTQTLLKEAQLFVEWYYPYVTGQPCPAATQHAYRDAWFHVLEALAPTPTSLVLRDYHVDNLMDVAGEGVHACGLLDFQDALWGPVVYDAVSLLEDARIDMDAPLRHALWARFTAHLNPWEKQAYEAAYAALGVCRHFKVLGVFTRYALRAGNTSKLIHVPRLWQYIERNISHPALAPVKVWYEGQRPCLHETH